MKVLKRLRKLQRLAVMCEIESDIGNVFSYEDFLFARKTVPLLVRVAVSSMKYMKDHHIKNGDALLDALDALKGGEEI